jgi:hypothetical protein
MCFMSPSVLAIVVACSQSSDPFKWYLVCNIKETACHLLEYTCSFDSLAMACSGDSHKIGTDRK